MTTVADLHSILDKDDWNLEDIKTFLERDSSSSVNKNRRRETPLIRVLQKKNCTAEVVRLLLKFGSKVNCRSRNNTHCLDVALQFSGRENIIKALLENGAKVRDSSLCVALHCGASKGVVELLLDAGCSMSQLCHHGHVLHCAVHSPKSGCLKRDVLQLLIDKGADVRAQTWKKKQTVLCSALQNGNEASTIQLLMDAGASLNDCASHSSALFCATNRLGYSTNRLIYGAPLRAEVVQLLLQSGASAKPRSRRGSPPLTRALLYCECEIEALQLLVSCLPNTDLSKKSYLHDAVMNAHCNPAVVEFLIKHGVMVNKLDWNKNSALHLTLKFQKNNSVVKALLKSGAEVHRINEDCESPLMSAIKYDADPDIVEQLVAAGAEIELPMFRYLLPKLPRIGLACIKVLFRYFYLRNSWFRYDDLNLPHFKYSRALLQFEDECKHELRKMESKQIGEDFTLYEFVCECDSSSVDSPVRKLPKKKCDLDQLVKAIAGNAYPLYFNVILATVNKDLEVLSSMEKVLEKVQVYTITHPLDNPCAEKKIILPYDIVCNIARFSAGDDFFRLILAFYKPCDRPSTGQSSSEKKNCMRKAKRVSKLPKASKTH